MVQATITQNETLADLTKSIDNVQPWRHVSEYLLNGTSDDLVVDGSGGSPVTFSYSPPTNYSFIANRIMLYMESSGNMTTTTFGDIATLGIGLEVKADGVLLTTWKDNPQIVLEMYDAMGIAAIVAGGIRTVMRGRWTFTRDMNGVGILVTDSFEVIVNDDLSSLVRFNIKVKGKLIPS